MRRITSSRLVVSSVAMLGVFLSSVAAAQPVAANKPRITPTPSISVAQREASIEFPNGTRVAVKLRKRSQPLPSVPIARKLILMHDELVQAAEAGDAPSATALYQALKLCDTAFQTEAELDIAIQLLYSDNKLTYPEGSGVEDRFVTGLVDPRAYEKMMRERFDFCDGVTPDQRDNAEYWLEFARTRGEFYAMKEWAARAGRNQETFAAWKEAWGNGIVTAAQELALFHKREIPEGQMDHSHRFYEYAYQLAYFAIVRAGYGDALSAELGDQMDNVLLNLGGMMSASEQDRAIEYAVSLVEENPNCCYVIHLAAE